MRVLYANPETILRALRAGQLLPDGNIIMLEGEEIALVPDTNLPVGVLADRTDPEPLDEDGFVLDTGTGRLVLRHAQAGWSWELPHGVSENDARAMARDWWRSARAVYDPVTMLTV